MKRLLLSAWTLVIGCFLCSTGSIIATPNDSDVQTRADGATIMIVQSVMPDGGLTVHLDAAHARVLAALVSGQEVTAGAPRYFLPEYFISFYEGKQLIGTSGVSFRSGFLCACGPLASNLHFEMEGTRFQTETAEAQKLNSLVKKLFPRRR